MYIYRLPTEGKFRFWFMFDINKWAIPGLPSPSKYVAARLQSHVKQGLSMTSVLIVIIMLWSGEKNYPFAQKREL